MVRRHSIARPTMSARWSCSAGTSRDDLVGVGADHVMRHHAFELAEPPRADLRQHRALHRNGLGHHDVERADAVGGQQQHAVVADGIDIAHLAAADPWQGQVAGEHRVHSVRLSRQAASRGARAQMRKRSNSSLRQRNELVFLAEQRRNGRFSSPAWPARSAPCWRRRNSTRYGAGPPARRRRETSSASACTAFTVMRSPGRKISRRGPS